MSILGMLFGGADSPVSQIVSKVLDYIPDPEQKAKAAAEAQAQMVAAQEAVTAALAASDAGQDATNTAEAANPSVYVSGARPAILWVCALALFCYYIPRFLIGTTLWVVGMAHNGWAMTPAPDLGIADLMGLLIPMLGLSAAHSFDKLKGTATAGLTGLVDNKPGK